MRLKALLLALLVAGFATSFAFAGGTRAGDTTTATTTKAKGPKCQKVELQGTDGSGSVTFTVKKASKKGSALKGKPATLALPAGSKVKATACLDASGNLTLQHLEVEAKAKS